jgi:predicted dehydrogenase
LRDALSSEGMGAVAFVHANAFQGGPLSAVYDERRTKLIREGGVDVLGRPEDKPDQAWFYQQGGGPLYDYGIYQVTMLTGLLGPVRRVTAFSGVRTPIRSIQVGRAAGRTFTTTEDDNTLVLLDFGEATFASVSASWHGNASSTPQLEFVCQGGTVSLPMGSPGDRRVVRVHRGSKWQDITVKGQLWTVASGLPNFARKILEGKADQSSILHARHVIDVLETAVEAGRSGRVQDTRSTFELDPVDRRRA